jgi:hypothetical protein
MLVQELKQDVVSNIELCKYDSEIANLQTNDACGQP